MLPKLSAPLVKDFRTGEGILEWVLGTLLVIASATNDLSWSRTALYATILAGIKGARRGLLKIVALQRGIGIGDPIQPTFSIAGIQVSSILDEIDASKRAIDEAQARPGTPADELAHGLSPDETSPGAAIAAGVASSPEATVAAPPPTEASP